MKLMFIYTIDAKSVQNVVKTSNFFYLCSSNQLQKYKKYYTFAIRKELKNK